MITNTSAVPLAESDLLKLQHMLGAVKSHPKRLWGYRNYYASPNSGDALDAMHRLKAAGLVREGRASGDLIYFHATEAGCRAAGLIGKQIKNALEE